MNKTTSIDRRKWPAQTELLERLEYKEGELYWLIPPRPGIPAGSLAGSLYYPGSRVQYRQIRIRDKCYRVSYLIWCMQYGDYPPRYLMHIDGNRLNTRIENLKACTATQSRQHAGLYANKRSSPYKGVTAVKYRGSMRYTSNIMADNRKYYLGWFLSEEEAYRAYCRAAKNLHGEFCDEVTNQYIKDHNL